MSSIVAGFTTIVVTIILTAGGITLYGMNMVDRKTESVIDIVRYGAANFPELVDSLPPMLADVVNHERAPGYAEQLEISAYVQADDKSSRRARSIIEVRNNGEETVSWLTVHVVVLNENGEPQVEWNEYVATPMAVDDDEWRGPLLPNTGTRRIPSHRLRLDDGEDASKLKVECQITDVRVWRPREKEQTVVVEEAAIPV